MKDKGILEIKKLLSIYVDSNQEVRDYIRSRVQEIQTETSCGLLVVENYIKK